jgi:hypothetical protein
VKKVQVQDTGYLTSGDPEVNLKKKLPAKTVVERQDQVSGRTAVRLEVHQLVVSTYSNMTLD